jgi:hypothetical protein
MSAEHDTSGTFTLLLSLDFKLMNNFKQNTENASILNVPFHIYHNTYYLIHHTLEADL